MNKPRARQRLPFGGKRLYELMRMDREPEVVCVFRDQEVLRERARLDDTLLWESAADPMLYFWPVESAELVVVFFLSDARPADDITKRLVKALQRDGARAIETVWRHDAPLHWQREPWGYSRFQYEYERFEKPVPKATAP